VAQLPFFLVAHAATLLNVSQWRCRAIRNCIFFCFHRRFGFNQRFRIVVFLAGLFGWYKIKETHHFKIVVIGNGLRYAFVCYR